MGIRSSLSACSTHSIHLGNCTKLMIAITLAGCSAADASTETRQVVHQPLGSAPTSHITALNAPSGIIAGTAVAPAGVVTLVEVSFDDGVTWNPAIRSRAGARVTWSYVSVSAPNVNPLVRATDSAGNVEVAHGPDDAVPPSGGFSVYSTSALDGSQGIVSSGFESAGWTTIVPMQLNDDLYTDLLWYNSVTGLAVYTIGTYSTDCGVDVDLVPTWRYCQKFASAVQAAPGWTAIVPMRISDDEKTDLLSYNANTGRAIYSVAATGPDCPTGVYCTQRVAFDRTDVTGATSIVPLNRMSSIGLFSRRSDLVFYNVNTGVATYKMFQMVVGGTGDSPVPGVPIDYLPPSDFNATAMGTVENVGAGFTSVVPLDMNSDSRTDILFYNAGSGRARYSVASSICSVEAYCPQQVVADFQAAAGWTSIVPLNLNNDLLTDLLSYNATSGLAVFSKAVPGSPGQQSVTNAVYGAQWWTSIVPVLINGDSRSDLLWYK